MLLSPPRPAAADARILIVEDEGIIANIIASRLVKSGYEVAGIAESSEEALAKITELNPELVLMDIRIKGATDGIETAAQIRRRFDIPFIFLSAHTDRQTMDRARTTGASGFLTKPVHHTNLTATIEMAIHKHRANRAGRDRRAWMATVLGTMADAMVVIDRDRKIQFLNGPAEELTGWKNEDARDLDVALVLPLAESASGFHLQVDELISPPSDARTRMQMPRDLMAGKRSGEWFPIEGEIAPSVDGGKVVGAVITFRDASARQAQENEIRHEHKMQAEGRLAAGIAHDFNNLLFVISGYAEEMLHSSALNGSDMRALTAIRKASVSATDITQQLLKFSRKEPARKQDLSLNELVRDTEELFHRPDGPSVKWQLKLAPHLGAVRADHGLLTQVLINLASNARDAMPDGGEVTIETANVDAPRAFASADTKEAFIALSFTDTGAGMSADTAARLFEPFFTNESGKGTGLGLSIVHSIVTDLGGTIRVDSAPGDGATFTVCIPRAGTAFAPPVMNDPGSRGAAARATVLVVDGEERVRHLLREYLASSGYGVIEAEAGGAAIRIANERDGPIDLLITDAIMPGANGFAVARALSERRPGMKTIFISGSARELVDELESLPRGARFLPKPLLKKDLLENVSELLEREKKLIMRSSV
jgi:two-component system cell cycle sensor histidine kinase/response regulator CckA